MLRRIACTTLAQSQARQCAWLHQQHPPPCRTHATTITTLSDWNVWRRRMTTTTDSSSNSSGSDNEDSSSDSDDSADEKDDAFSLFGLAPHFDIDESNLKVMYRKFMKDLHPDKHGGLPRSEQLALEQKAANITNAYDILTQPHLRATHLLAQIGFSLDDATDVKIVGPDFLLDVMELRQSIEMVEEGTDGDATLRPLLLENQSRIDETIANLTKMFDSGDVEGAMKFTAQLQYWNKVDETLREKMKSLD